MHRDHWYARAGTWQRATREAIHEQAGIRRRHGHADNENDPDLGDLNRREDDRDSTAIGNGLHGEDRAEDKSGGTQAADADEDDITGWKAANHDRGRVRRVRSVTAESPDRKAR